MFLTIKDLPKVSFWTQLVKKWEHWYKVWEQDGYEKWICIMLDLAREDWFLKELHEHNFEKPITVDDFIHFVMDCPKYKDKYLWPRNQQIIRDNNGRYVLVSDILKELTKYK